MIIVRIRKFSYMCISDMTITEDIAMFTETLWPAAGSPRGLFYTPEIIRNIAIRAVNQTPHLTD